MKRLALLALCVMGLGAESALADQRSVSYSNWAVSGNSVILRFVVPVTEAQRLTGVDLPLLTSAKLADYILQHVAVKALAGNCPAIDQGYDIGQIDPLSVGAGLYGFEIIFRCPARTDLVLQNRVLFEHVPGHVNFARVQTDAGFTEQLFTADRQQLQVPASSAMPNAGVAEYLKLGWMHILRSLDRLCFLFASILLVRRPRDLGYIVLSLGIGYLLSVAESAGHWIVPRMAPLEACIGLLVSVLALKLITPQLRRPRVVVAASAALLLLLAAAALIARDLWPALVLAGAALFAASFLEMAGRSFEPSIVWLLPAALFGFLDGFVLPSELAPLQLPDRKVIPMLGGFDGGALLVEALLLLMMAGVFVLLRRRRITLPRPLVNDIAAACLAGVGSFWLLSRIYA